MIFKSSLRPLSVACIAATCLVAGSVTGSATVLFEYDADAEATAPTPTDPAWGWFNYVTTANPPVNQGPASFQKGTETIGGFSGNYIKFNDNNSAFGVLQHDFTPTADMGTEGWTLTAVGRVIQSSQGSAMATHLRVFYAGKSHQITFVNDAVGGREGVVLIDKDDSLSIPAQYAANMVDFDLDSAYFTIQLYYDPTDATINLYGNGQFLMSMDASESRAGWGSVDNSVHWGRGTSGSSVPSESYWNEIRFESGYAVIPEPSTLALAGAGLLGAALLRRKSRRG